MNHDVRSMLEGMYAQVYREFRNPELAWDRFVEYIAAEHSIQLVEQFPGFMTWLFEHPRLRNGLGEAYSMSLHCSDYHDHLGEMYEDRLERKELSGLEFKFTSMADANRLAEKLIEETEREISIYAPAVGTGRVLMAAHKRAPNAHLFGTEPDLRAVRIAITNFAIYDISGYILHADARKHEIDLSTVAGQENWHRCNKWNSYMHELKPRIRPPKPPSFSTSN